MRSVRQALSALRKTLRAAALGLFRTLGTEIRDERTGQPVGRAFIIGWGGRVQVLGLTAAVFPVPRPQPRLTYWRQEFAFASHPLPDAAPDADLASAPISAGERTLVVVLDHRSPAQVSALLNHWCPRFAPAEDVLLAYGGPAETFPAIPWPQKVFLDDPRLRTRDHQRELQSYHAIFRQVAAWMEGRNFTHVLFMEGDHLPLVEDLTTRYLHALRAEAADVLAYELERFDHTLHPHWLNARSAGWDEGITLSMLGTGHFWRREAWDAVARSPLGSELYLELHLPTAAHRLGYRVRPVPASQRPFVHSDPRRIVRPPARAAASGAWTIHPWKAALP